MKRKIKNINIRFISAMVFVMVCISFLPFAAYATQASAVNIKQ